MAGIKVGRAEVERLKKQATGAMSRLRSVREKAEETAMVVVRSATVSGTAFLFGLTRGRFIDEQTGKPGVEIFGVPVELVAAAGFHVLGFMGSDKYGQHLHNFGDGALAAYTVGLGIDVGTRMRQQAPAQPAQAASGALPRPRMTTQQLYNLARQRQAQRARV